MEERRLTSKQECFAYSIGYENMTYSKAYRLHYSTKNMNKKTIWHHASVLANNGKVSARIDEFKEMKRVEMQRSFSWSLKEAEKDLRIVLQKNLNDIMRAEKEGKTARASSSSAVLNAINELNKMSIQISSVIQKSSQLDIEIKEEQKRNLKIRNDLVDNAEESTEDRFSTWLKLKLSGAEDEI
jgi:hypothetical protein